MRRSVVFLTLLALAAPFAASASVSSPGDGSLSVHNLNGQLDVRARGSVIGRCDQCVLVLNERPNAEELDPVVSGARGIDTDDDGAKERFVGRDLRWKVIGGSFKMVVRQGVDVDLSLVGKGRVATIQGTSGTFVLNGGDTEPVLPGSAFAFPLGPPAVTP